VRPGIGLSVGDFSACCTPSDFTPDDFQRNLAARLLLAATQMLDDGQD
jgi:hypothetical protein